MAPNGKIIEWYPKPDKDQNLSTDRVTQPQKRVLMTHDWKKYKN